jgi:signal transduction histidine kinase
LHLMNYRARAIGASIEIAPGPRNGTIVTCRLSALAKPSRRDGQSP